MQPVIVGIDPGTTSAFAVLSFNFEVLFVKSRKNYSFAELISDIYKIGNPIIVGTDKKDIPSFIKEFSQKTGAKVYTPSYDTKKSEKKQLVKDNNLIDLVKNPHETDALASAIYAYKHYGNLIRKVKSNIKEEGKEDLFEKIMHHVITKEKSISQAIKDIEEKPEKKNIKITIPKIQTIKKELTKDEKKIILLKDEINSLKEKLHEERIKRKKLENKEIDIDKVVKNKISFKEKRALTLEQKMKLLKKENKKKDRIIKTLNKFIINSSGKVLIKKIDNLGKDSFDKAKIKLNIETNDILLVNDISIISKDIAEQIKENNHIIIHKKGKSSLLSTILIDFEKLTIIENKHFAYCSKEDLNNTIKEESKKIKIDKNILNNIIDEYRRKREI